MAADDLIELDRVAGTRHPREAVALYGHEKEEAAFLDAYRTGRMPHAWLLAGPEGIGKASFAWRAARFILTHPDPSSDAVQKAQSLDVDPQGEAARMIAAQAHPDLFVLRREMEAGLDERQRHDESDHVSDVSSGSSIVRAAFSKLSLVTSGTAVPHATW